MIAHEVLSAEIGGKPVAELRNDLISLEVELDDELAAMFRLRLTLEMLPDKTWSYLDDERYQLWQPVSLGAGFVESGSDALISGYITHLKPEFDPEPSRCTLEVWGMDGSVLMDREEKLKAWPGKKDSDIAAEIFDQYPFKCKPDDTHIIHDEKVSTIIQRETDIQFLRRLALRNGFECYVEGETGYFRRPRLEEPPQPVLAAYAESNTSLDRFSVEVNATRPTHVTMHQIDRLNKTELEAVIDGSLQPALGGTDANGLLPPKMRPAQLYPSGVVATGWPEMDALGQGLYHQAEWFVTVEGEINAHEYKHVLRPRRTVVIKGVGETYSGLYYVSHVTHTITPDGGYRQTFRAKRNALGVSGKEDFSATAGLF